MQKRDVSMESIHKEPETNTDEGQENKTDGNGGDTIQGDNPNNINNNQLGEFSQSTEPVDKKKRPSILSNAAFLLAVVAIILAAICSWFWYNWIWIFAVPAFVVGLVALTCSDNPKMSFLWAVLSLILSLVSIAWSTAMLIICFDMCTCSFFGEKRVTYNQMAHHLTNGTGTSDIVPCVYVKFPPRPVQKDIAEGYKYCFPSPIDTALFGYQNGYTARDCKPPPDRVCNIFDWFEAKRKEERTKEWAWKDGPNIFAGSGDVPAHEKCKRDSDCELRPDFQCFGADVDSSICVNGSSVELGDECNFNEQCEGAKVEFDSNLDKCEKSIADLFKSIHVKCINYMCVARSNCPWLIPASFKYSSTESKGMHFCNPECSPCGGCNNRGQCVRGNGGWECVCQQGSFGPNCKYGVDSTDFQKMTVATGSKGICQFMSKLCEPDGECEPSTHAPSGFHCKCHSGKTGQYCKNSVP